MRGLALSAQLPTTSYRLCCAAMPGFPGDTCSNPFPAPPCRMPPLPRWAATSFVARIQWEVLGHSSRDPCSRGQEPVWSFPQTLPSLMSQSSENTSVTKKLAHLCFYAFKEGLPAPPCLWQEFPEQFSGFCLQEFMILMLVLDTYLVSYQRPDGVTTSLHVWRGSQGNWLSPRLYLETSLIFMSPLHFLVYSLRVFTDNKHTEIPSI